MWDNAFLEPYGLNILDTPADAKAGNWVFLYSKMLDDLINDIKVNYVNFVIDDAARSTFENDANLLKNGNKWYNNPNTTEIFQIAKAFYEQRTLKAAEGLISRIKVVLKDQDKEADRLNKAVTDFNAIPKKERR
ncbi:hypothetical protein ACJA23_01590 [Mycoplasma corogypsi]|uniref:hypothetical protein n=1 Tax=Mycoplasma corogypsi TaxID=2106 RepID=UPI00387328F0